MNEAPLPEDWPEAQVQTRRRPFQMIWLIPLVAAVIAGFLAWHSLRQRGPTITITWRTGDGLQAGQTKVRHKAVELGTVRSVELSDDMKQVIATVEMQRQATRFLTGNARFWVVRPRIASGSLAGIETLVSGAYIELDPGAPGGESESRFTGLEEPPAIRSDEPGRTFRLQATRLGSLSVGSPVFFRDIEAGEMLNFDLGANGRQLTLQVFIRSPYDRFVHEGTHFWNASGVSVDLGASGVQLQLESLRAVLAGGIAFDTSEAAQKTEPSPAGATFTLYPNEAAARVAGYKERITFATYVEGSVRGLAAGAPVEFYGIQIGNVTDVQLQFDPDTKLARVAVRMELQPERFMHEITHTRSPLTVSRGLVQRGLRAQLRTANYLTGQMFVALDFFPNAPAAEVLEEDGVIVLPTMPGGLDSITASIGGMVQKLNNLPLEEIAKNLNDTLAGASAVANSGDLRDSLRQLAATLTTTQELVRRLNAGVAPALQRIPEMAQTLQSTLERANGLVGSAEAGYGRNSQFRRDIERLMGQVSDAARSLRLLADYLNAHPEALLRGR
ncbi:Paraquat-inducible protein B [Rhodovastum atsumiense]|uniref:MCE family protein n=1 Tax=Rhodovastum atsumiense TaxID=504468 RepID=A0A5M6IVF5_9PROT|nr:MlaD family protein [Rhodovastum atsumiense]KAA5612293.1 MCE family protein [Rhodovastum atsumiense]CAH2601623.1 Paraquat-inducible protein B [Rhodovastum atsumiense]